MSNRQNLLGSINKQFIDWRHGVWGIDNISNKEKIRRFRSKVKIVKTFKKRR